MERKYLHLEDLEAYKTAFKQSNVIRDVVVQWNNFAKDTVGKQSVRTADSILANIVEGFGRYSKKDKINFYHYTKGSVLESLDWLNKAKARKLLLEAQAKPIETDLEKIPHLIN